MLSNSNYSLKTYSSMLTLCFPRTDWLDLFTTLLIMPLNVKGSGYNPSCWRLTNYYFPGINVTCHILCRMLSRQWDYNGSKKEWLITGILSRELETGIKQDICEQPATQEWIIKSVRLWESKRKSNCGESKVFHKQGRGVGAVCYIPGIRETLV